MILQESVVLIDWYPSNIFFGLVDDQAWPENPFFNPLSANLTKWSNTLKQFVTNLLTNCLNVFDHFVKLALKELNGLNDDNNDDDHVLEILLNY